jgi:serine phosphatase RsbU (regulator of sigma subunit)
MATLVHVQLDRERRRLEFVRAGHPPPLLRNADGSIVELDGGAPPVGVYDLPGLRSSAVAVEPSSLLLLYTDGLMERRGEDLQTGLERLKSVLARAPQEPEECVSWMIERLDAAGREDDVAVVAMSLS